MSANLSKESQPKWEQKWMKIFPELAGTDVTSDEHISPENFKREIDLVFRRTWLFAGIESDIPNPGDYIVREFQALKVSLLLVRGSDTKVRVFHNVCRHRAATLLPSNARGNKRAFACEFHGWTYGLDGALLAVTDPDGLLKREELGLVELPSRTWNGFIFFNPEQKPRETFEQWLGEMALHPMNQFPFVAKDWESWGWRCEVDADWKVVKDLFIESYHVSFLHRITVDNLYSAKENPFHHWSAVDFYGKHQKATLGSSPPSKTLMMGPIAKASVKFGGTDSSRFGKAKNAAPGLNPDGLENWGVDEYSMFPNFNIHFFGGLWHYHLFEPLGVGRSAWENRIFFPKAKNAGERFAHGFSHSLQIIVGLEDLAAAERNQAGMESGAIKKLALHEQEVQLRQMRKTLQEYMRA